MSAVDWVSAQSEWRAWFQWLLWLMHRDIEVGWVQMPVVTWLVYITVILRLIIVVTQAVLLVMRMIRWFRTRRRQRTVARAREVNAKTGLLHHEQHGQR